MIEEFPARRRFEARRFVFKALDWAISLVAVAAVIQGAVTIVRWFL